MKTFKRTLSCFLALLMIFGSFSVLSYATLNDGNLNSAEVYTKFFVDGVETDTVKAGDTVKARIYIATDFKLGTTTLFWVYPLDFMTFDASNLTDQGGYYGATELFNSSATSIPVVGSLGGFVVHEENVVIDSESTADNLIYEGYVGEDYFDDKGWIALTINKGTPTVVTTDEYFIEFSFTVNDDATGEGYLYVPEESVMNTTDQEYGFSAIQRARSDTQFAVLVNEQAYKMEYDLQLNDKNTIKLAAAEATKYAVTYSFTGDVPEGYDTQVPAATEAEEGDSLSLPVITVPSGYRLTWSAKGATKNTDGTYTVGTEAVAFTGTWAKLYPVTYVYAGETPDGYTAPAAIELAEGEAITEPTGITIPEGYTLTWATEGAVDGKMGTEAVTMKGTWAKIDYDVTYSYANEAPKGAAAAPAAGTTTVGATIAAPSTDAPAGYTLTWAVTGATKNDDGSYTAGANDVKFVGTWVAIDYNVTYSYANEAPEGAAAAPAAGTVNAGGTIAAPSTDAPAGYTLTWAVTGATKNDDGSYTAGANDVKFVGTWAAIEYAVTYSYANEAPEGAAAAPAAGTVNAGGTIAAPSTDAPAGYTLTWAVTGATKNDDGSYTAGANDVEFVGTWATVEYDVTYSYANEAPAGAAAAPAAGKTTVGATINPGITAPDGYTLTWAVTGATDNGDGTYTAGANDVEFVGTWATIEYAVTYSFANEGPDGVDAPAAGKTTVGATINPGITAPDGYTLTWAVTGATKNDDGSYTAGANDVEFVGTWAKKSYTITYYLSEQDKADGKVYDTQTFEFGEAVAAIEDPKVAGKAFDAWDIDVPSTMPAENLEAVAIFSDYIVTFYDVFGDELKDYTMTAVSEITEADLPSAEDATAGEDVNFVEWQLDGAKLKTPYALEGSVDVYAYCTVDIVFYADEEMTAEHYTLTVDFGHIYTEDDIAGVGEPTKPGHDFDGWDVDFVDSEALQNNYAVPSFVPNDYTATFMANGEVYDTKTATFGTEIEAPATDPKKEGYTFTGWAESENGVALDKLTMDAEGKTFYAVFVENGKVAYTVEIYLMDETGAYGAPVEKSGTAIFGTEVTVAHADYEQEAYFSADLDEANKFTDVVAEDGSTVLKLYYERAQYDVVIDGAAAEKVYHGATVTAPSTSADTPAGYELASWNNGAYTMGQEIEVTGNLTLTPDFVAGTSTYTIKTYTMGLDGEYGEAVEATDTYTTDETVTYTAPAVEGFKADKDSYSVKVTGDNKAVIEVYYARNQYDVTIDGAASKVYHGATVTAPSTSANTPAGYSLASWNDGAVALGQEIEVTGDLTLTPDYTANTNTKYTVEIYLMDTEGNYAETADDVDVLEGTTDTPATAAHADYPQADWFTPAATGNVTETTITGDGNAVLKLYFERAQYDVTIDGVTTKAYHGAKITAPETTTATVPEGFTFTGWNNGAYAKGQEIEVTEALTLTPDIVANDATDYSVEIYLQDAEGNYAETASKVETESGKTGEEITIAHADYAQEDYYLADDAEANVFTGTIAGDGSLVLKLYFKRATYDVIVDGEVVAEDVIHGAEVTLPEESDNIDEGNELDGWTDGKNTYEPGETIVVEGALDLTPVQKPSDATKYTISIYMMDTDGNDYVGTSTVSYGTTGATQTIVPDYSREGFTVNTEKSKLTGTIVADGSLVLSVYYDRNLYTATFDGVEYQVYYGASLPEVEPAAQEGKKFDAWTPAVPATMPADDLEFTSTWTDVMYKIIYIINGTEEEYEYAAGATVTPRENPTVPGMTFIKWNKTIPETMPAEDVIIVAEFEAAVFKVTFLDGDGKVWDEKAVQYGDTIVLPTSNPTKEYHVFNGWIDVPETMPAANVTIYPDFERVPVRLVAAEGSTTVIDRSTMIITGLKTKFSDAKADNYLAIEGDGYYTLTPVEGYTGYYGTGAKVEVYDNADTSAPIEVFYIVIYGDVNGDSAVNSLDGSLVEDESMYVSSWSRGDTKDELKVMAADLNKDGKVTANDANDIVNTALGITSIDQVTGTVIR